MYGLLEKRHRDAPDDVVGAAVIVPVLAAARGVADAEGHTALVLEEVAVQDEREPVRLAVRRVRDVLR